MPLESTISLSERTDRYRFFVLTCRDPRSDFRLPLVDALRQNYETYYIWLRRRPIVAGPARGDFPVEMSLSKFFAFIWRFKKDSKINVYFNSTNTSFPGVTVFLRLIASPGIWCLDMHDDLRYHYDSLKRVRTMFNIMILRAASDLIVHAAPTLKELFPRSQRLGNASHILPIEYNGNDRNAILILASFDERFDFDFLTRLAELCPLLQFHLHGWTRRDDPMTLQRILALADDYTNIHYHGPYTTADLPAILSAYRVCLAPYLTNSLLTRYIEPLRYYHCLNAGIEVVSTDIPQAQWMREYVHIVSDAMDCAATLPDVLAGKLAKKLAYSPITWDLRVNSLVEILTGLPRTKVIDKYRAMDLTIAAADFETSHKRA